MDTMNYDVFRKYYANPFEGGKYANFLEDALPTLEEQSFVKEYKAFYSKGIFKDDEELSIYFFTNKTLHAVNIETENMVVKSWNNTEISSVDLIIPDRYNLGLAIYLKDGVKLEFNSNLDTNSAWSTRFRDNIKEIHKLLTNI